MGTDPVDELPFYASDERFANWSKLAKDLTYGWFNGLLSGAPDKMWARKPSRYFSNCVGNTLVDVGANLGIAATSFSNMLTFGFQDAIFNGIKSAQERMMEQTLNQGYDPTDLTSAIWIRGGGTLIGAVQGSITHVMSILPADEYRVIDSKETTDAEKWSAGAMAVSKVANLAALGAGVRQNIEMLGAANSGYRMEVLTAKHPKYSDPTNYHSSVFLSKVGVKSGYLFERDGRGTVFRRVNQRPKLWNNYRYSDSDQITINISKRQYDKLRIFANEQIRDDWVHGKSLRSSIYFDNCSRSAHTMVGQVLSDVAGYSPQALRASVQTSLENPNFLKAAKGGMIGTNTLSPAKKN